MRSLLRPGPPGLTFIKARSVFCFPFSERTQINFSFFEHSRAFQVAVKRAAPPLSNRRCATLQRFCVRAKLRIYRVSGKNSVENQKMHQQPTKREDKASEEKSRFRVTTNIGKCGAGLGDLITLDSAGLSTLLCSPAVGFNCVARVHHRRRNVCKMLQCTLERSRSLKGHLKAYLQKDIVFENNI